MKRTLASSALGLLFLLTAPSARAQEWEELYQEKGITVWQREVKGTSFVEFRGRGMVEASIRDLAAVIRDNNKKTEWMHHCAEDFAIQYLGPLHIITYNRTASPVFFISDRDVVLDVKATLKPEAKSILIEFRQTKHPRVPERDGVVRMPRLTGYWLLEAKSPTQTELTYQVAADPGGALPAWLVNAVSKDMPLRTIDNVRAQIGKPGYKQQYLVLDQVIDWVDFGLPGTSTTAQ